MTQRKLTDEELKNVMAARSGLRKMCPLEKTSKGHEWWVAVLAELDWMANYATTDGKPCVEYAPPIPDGYRKATEADAKRNDRKFWDRFEQKWVVAVQMSYAADVVFIVPIETPTPEGYRKAVAGDIDRRDVQCWDATTGRYKDCGSWTAGMPFGNDRSYIVPIDRVPTDDDAKSRPEVMVRDCDGQKWHPTKHILILVRCCEHSKYKFATTDTERIEIVCWKYCRHLYPGE